MALDLEKIAVECNIANAGFDETVVSYIDKLSLSCSEDELAIIYGYLIQKTSDTKMIGHLIKCLDKIRYSASLDLLMEIVLLKGRYQTLNENDDSFINTRILAIKAVSNLKDTRAVVGLLDCLNNKHENYKVRLNLADALGKIGDKYAVAPLIDIANDENEKSSYVRESAVAALGMLGDMRAFDPLVSILEGQKGLMDKFTFLKERVIEVLGKFNFSNDRMIKALKGALLDDSLQIRINAIEALMNTEDERAFELIKSMLNDSNAEVVQNAVIALYNLSDVEILNEIIESDCYSDVAKIQAAEIKSEYEEDDEL